MSCGDIEQLSAQEKLLPWAAEARAATLRDIVASTRPSAQHVAYHDALLQHLLALAADQSAEYDIISRRQMIGRYHEA